MATAFDIDEQAQRATTGTQDFTGSLGSVNGECGIILATRAITLGTIADHAEFDIGFQVGAGSGATLNANSENGVTPDARTNKSAANVVEHSDPGTSTVQDSAAPNAQVTDGLQVNFDPVSGAQYRTIVGPFGGDGISSAIVTANEVTTAENSTFVISGLSFQPQALIFIFDGAGTADVNHFRPGIGVAVDNGAGTDQFAINLRCAQTATSESDGYFATNRCQLHVDTTALISSWEVTNWETDGATITMRDAAGANKIARVLCLASSDWTFVAGTYDVPTSGNVTESGLGIDPEFLFNVISQIQTVDTHIDNSTEASVIGVALVASAAEFGISASVQRNVSTSLTKSLSDNATVCLEDGGTVDIEATTALGTDQFVLTPTNHPASVTKAFYLAAGPTTGGAANASVVLKRNRHF